MTDEKRLRALLQEDFEQVDDALIETIQQLRHWNAPIPDEQQTAKLIETLLPEMPAERRRHFDQFRDSMPVLLLKAQARVVQREIWIVSLLMMLLGTLVTLATAGANSGTLPLVLIAPLVAAIGVGYVYGPMSDPALEVELATPVSSRVVLLARLVLVFGFNFILGLMGSLVLAVFHAELLLWQVVLAWFAPMALLSALAFLLSVLLVDVTISVAISILLWALQTLRYFAPESLFIFRTLPDFSLPQTQPLALVIALVMGAAALWLAGLDECWIQNE